MKFFIVFERLMRRIFPSTFTIALALTVATMLLALLLTEPVDIGGSEKAVHKEIAGDPVSGSDLHLIQIFGFWYKGMWQSDLLAFAIQMMLILVLGYVLASTSLFRNFIGRALIYCNSTANAAFIVCFFTLVLGLLNWGLGLIFGAIFAARAGEHARKNSIPLNYPLIVAAGYSGLMVWHGGISGSAPLKVAEAGHLRSLTGLDLQPVDFGETVFSGMNLAIALALLIIIPASLYFLGKSVKSDKNSIPESEEKTETVFKPQVDGAERADHSRTFGIGIGIILLGFAAYKAIATGDLSVIDPNYINFILLGSGLLLCGTIAGFLRAVAKAMPAAGGILIQFPLYFGIMGIMKYSGLVEVFSGFLMEISNGTTFPVFTLFSAGIVNVFVPSGGGQWAVQGPIIIEAAQNLNVPLGKAVMALAYGDQLTNMMQPFWALPLLGITGLKARDIIPYTLYLMLIATVIFISGLLLF